jgi:hypothetical protein
VKKILSSVILLFTVCFLHGQVLQKPNVRPDYADVKEMVEKYGASIVNADSILAYSLFDHTAKVSFIHARGDEHGWDNISRNIYKFLGDTYTIRKLTIDYENFWILECAARVELHYTFNAVLKKDNSNVQIKYRETQLWRKTNDEWKLAEVHDSNMPVN